MKNPTSHRAQPVAAHTPANGDMPALSLAEYWRDYRLRAAHQTGYRLGRADEGAEWNKFVSLIRSFVTVPEEGKSEMIRRLRNIIDREVADYEAGAMNQRDERMEQIVRACNSHAALVEALEAFINKPTWNREDFLRGSAALQLGKEGTPEPIATDLNHALNREIDRRDSKAPFAS